MRCDHPCEYLAYLRIIIDDETPWGSGLESAVRHGAKLNNAGSQVLGARSLSP
jgi:hypothetical protein